MLYIAELVDDLLLGWGYDERIGVLINTPGETSLLQLGRQRQELWSKRLRVAQPELQI